eukprot:730393-Rhodomonas_salina.1
MFEDYDKHYVAEFRLTGLIAQMLGWAGDLEEGRGIAGAVQARAVQVRDFNTAFQKMQTMLRKQTDRLVRGEEFY